MKVLLRYLCLMMLAAIGLRGAAETAAERHARYHDPDFQKLAREMVAMCQQQAQKCIQDESLNLSVTDYAPLVESEYYLPVVGLIDQLDIAGFDVANLKTLGLDPVKNQNICELMSTLPKRDSAAAADELSRLLAVLYKNYGMKVRSMYNVHNSGDRLTAYVYGERQQRDQQQAVKLTFDEGRLTNVSGIKPPLKIEAPVTKTDEFSYDYLAFPERWNNAIPDTALWQTLFDYPRWRPEVSDGEIVVVSDKGSLVTGYDRNYYVCKALRNKHNRLFADWFVPYAGLELDMDAPDTSQLRLMTRVGLYDIDSAGHLPEADAASGRVLESIMESLSTLRGQMAQEDVEWGSRSYIEVLGCEINNTDNGFNLLDSSGTLYAGDVRFLAPKLHIRAHTSIPRDIMLLHKIIGPNGKLISMSWSPRGYTAVTTRPVNPDEDVIVLTGWGNEDQAVFKPGQYRLEVYAESGDKIYEMPFKIATR